VQMVAELSGCTIVLLRGAHEMTESYPERTMADGLILLTTTRLGMRGLREMEVQKHRGRAHVMGRNFFEISARGVSVYPRTEARIEVETAAVDENSALRSTGIKSLDVMLQGGVRADSTTMLLGPPGVGKTLLGLQFLNAGAGANETCLYCGFDEPPPRILRKAKSIGMDLGVHASSGVLDIQWHPPREPLADCIVETLLANVRRRGVRRIFIDGFGGLRAGLIYPERALPFASSLDGKLRALGVTVLWSEEITTSFGSELVIPTGASQTVDNILLLRRVEQRAQTRRLISVMKTSGQGHENSVRELRITNHGVQIASTSETAEAVLTDVARRTDRRSVREAAQRAPRKSAGARARRARK
jgi:circadian clock protein KaiC